jgi:hypothetical protein
VTRAQGALEATVGLATIAIGLKIVWQFLG